MIKTLLHFLEYFNEKVDYTKNVLLGFEKVESIYVFSVFGINAERFE